MDPREVIALALADTYDIVDEEDGMYGWGLGTNAIIAALPAAGMTICGEQVGVVFSEPSMSGDRLRFTSHVREPQNEHERKVFVLSDPQEGDK